ncbi:hypothetical protein LOC68_10415 [Blastopirellula sp. JC732]|uniref:Uncharacterized protein n=1 Tax=Blastopirellula sediminis TaxID=2894196 RepID=A0A9X1SGB5_9BACT|nr:hypothetical protein [Blastopirellula sediminis]MCC9608411.1 hypothetical protein [Blastopirellula sediminis]MCC9628812.1 hypothetical protein [Blastopirellula sediminis]
MCVKGKNRNGKVKGQLVFVCKKCGQVSDNPLDLCKAKQADGFFDKKGKGKK